VVLQRFRGELVLLDSRGGGGGGDDYGGGYDSGSSGFGGGGGGGSRPQSRPAPAFDSDLDDDVPF
jgi:single-strand DNA-binding protein